jgi:arylsulfatase A
MLRGSGGSLKPNLVTPGPADPVYELNNYNVEEDPGETTNLYFKHPEIVERLTKEITMIIENGRSTPGTPQPYAKENWPQLTWMNP